MNSALSPSRSPLVLVTLLLASVCPLWAWAADPPNPAREKDHPPAIPLWSNGAPGSESRKAEAEVVQWRKEPDLTFPVVSNIHNPSITPYLPPKDKATGAAVIIAPGGGHQFLTTDREGYDVARWLADRGIAAFVLKYRLARDAAGPSGYKADVHALADARRAIRLVRSRAPEWGVNPRAVGILGFSAGGQVAAYAATRPEEPDPNAPDPIDRLDARPDFQVLIYAALMNVSMTPQTPPTFLLAANDDRLAEMSANAYLALRKAGVPAEIHVYAHGGHGFGLRDKPSPVFGWPNRLLEWMGDTGFLKDAKEAKKP